MTFSSDDLLRFNNSICTHASWKQRTRGKVNAESRLLELGLGPWDIADVVGLAVSIVCGQWFTDGNHRTALLVIYYGMIDELKEVTRIPPYQLYAKLDYVFYKGQGGRQTGDELKIGEVVYDPGQKITEFILGRGLVKLHSEEMKVARRTSTLQAVKDLPSILEQLTKYSNYDKVWNDAEFQKRKVMAASADYKRNKARMKIFKALNGGSLSHSSSR